MAKQKKKLRRFDLRVEREWLEQVEREAAYWGLSASGYLRVAALEKMERDRRQRRKEGEEKQS